MKNFCKAGGFTIIEMMITIAVMSVVIAAMLLLIQSGHETYEAGLEVSKLQIYSTNLVTTISRDLKESSPTRVITSNGGESIFFQVPVDLEGDGNVLQAGTWAVDWGGTSYAGVDFDSHVIEYAFDQTGNESEAGIDDDINADGDKTDTFRKGRIVRRLYDAGMNLIEEEAIGSDFLLATGNAGGDVDGDGANDPIFQVLDSTDIPELANGRNVVQIVLFTYGIDDFNKSFSKKVKTLVSLMNN